MRIKYESRTGLYAKQLDNKCSVYSMERNANKLEKLCSLQHGHVEFLLPLQIIVRAAFAHLQYVYRWCCRCLTSYCGNSALTIRRNSAFTQTGYDFRGVVAGSTGGSGAWPVI